MVISGVKGAADPWRVLAGIASSDTDSADYLRHIAQRALLSDGAPPSWSRAVERIDRYAEDPDIMPGSAETARMLAEALCADRCAPPEVYPHGRLLALVWGEIDDLYFLIAGDRYVEGLSIRRGRVSVRYARIAYTGGLLPPPHVSGIPVAEGS